MDTSRVLARIMGPLLIITALGVFLDLKSYQRLVEEFSKSPGLCYVGGFVALLLGLITLQFHSNWEPRWPVIITILGWIAVVKGVALIIFPGFVAGLWHPFMTSSAPLIVSLGISFAIGVFLSIKGYWE
jgi:hypothetical protein